LAIFSSVERGKVVVDQPHLVRALEVGQLRAGGRRRKHHARGQVGGRAPGAGSTKATGTSSSMRCGRATTAHSCTPGTAAITRSISDAATFSPPTFSMSLVRSPKRIEPSSSRSTRSPVRNQPSAV
jgi:hypothetical protein